jgi:peptide/nickel transport system substrate-binding protein
MFTRVNDTFLVEVPAAGGTLHEGLIGLPRTINPVLAITEVDRDISALVYAGLMKYSGDKLVPDLAKSYTISENGLEYTFTLRDDIRFHDGAAVTAHDVVFTIQKIQEGNLKSPRRPDWTTIAVTAKSPTEVVFTLKQPYAPFLTNTTVGIIPKHIWGTLNDNEFIFSSNNIEPIGAGPYKVNSVLKDSEAIPYEYHLIAWSRYHGKVPYITSIIFSFFSDESKAVEALSNGSIDSIPAISAAAAAQLKPESQGSYTITSESLPRIFGVFFNQNHNPLLADKVVRQALEMSVDRNAIINSVLFGYGTPITGPLPTETSVQITGTKSIATSSVHIIEAMEFLEKNGWKKNATGVYEKKTKTSTQELSFTLFTADTPDLKKTAEILKNYWIQLGVNIDVKVFESNDLYQNIIRTRKYDALLFGEQIGKDRDLYAFWHSSQRNAPGLNISMYTNSKADTLLEDIRVTSNDAARAKKYIEFDTLIRTDIPAIFLYSPDFIYPIPQTIHNVQLGNMTTPSDRWNSIESWYIVTEKVWKWFVRE